MTSELMSIPDIGRRMPREHHARKFLEGLIWTSLRYCPYCGSDETSALRGKSCRPGLFQCRDCRGQFKGKTPTLMHGTKLDLRLWIFAVYLILTSRRCISSVVMGRFLGIKGKTAWMLGHRIREMTDDRNCELDPMGDIVGEDQGLVGGAPKSLKRANKPPGKACGKRMVFVAASRDGQARATVVANDQQVTLEPVLHEWIVPENTTLMTDGSTSCTGIGQTMADHHSVIHSQKQYALSETGAPM